MELLRLVDLLMEAKQICLDGADLWGNGTRKLKMEEATVVY